MNSKLKKLILQIAELRLLDGYISFLKIWFFHKLLALYGTTLYIWEFSLSIWGWIAFATHLSYDSGLQSEIQKKYSRWSISLKIFNHYLVDTHKQLHKELHEWWLVYDKELKLKEKETERLIELGKKSEFRNLESKN